MVFLGEKSNHQIYLTAYNKYYVIKFFIYQCYIIFDNFIVRMVNNINTSRNNISKKNIIRLPNNRPLFQTYLNLSIDNYLSI
jgi:hypothetical protein